MRSRPPGIGIMRHRVLAPLEEFSPGRRNVFDRGGRRNVGHAVLVKDGCHTSTRKAVTVPREEMGLLCVLERFATVALDEQQSQSTKRYDQRDDQNGEPY